MNDAPAAPRTPDERPQDPTSAPAPGPAADPALPWKPEGADPRPERPYQRMRRLAREEQQVRGDFFGRLRASTPREVVTTTLVAANCAVFAAMVTTGVHLTSPDVEGLLRWGAMRPLLTRDGEPWRMLTACFLHVGIVHLAVNMFSLWSLRFVEVWFGRLAFAVAYVVSGLCGSLASTTFSDPFTVSAGASGAIFGLLGAVLGAAIRWRRIGVDSRVTKPIVRGVANTILLNAMIALTIPHLDHAAHAGGFGSGVVLGYLLAHAPTPEGVGGRGRRGWAVGAISLALVVGAVLALQRPGLAAAGERVETVRTDEAQMVAASRGDVPIDRRPDDVLGSHPDEWLPWLDAKIAELERDRAAFPALARGIDEELTRYRAIAKGLRSLPPGVDLVPPRSRPR